MTAAPSVPLSAWADAQLAAIVRLSAAPAPALAALSAASLLGERAALNHLRIPARVSAGGGCRLYETASGEVALALPRADDRALLPALFGDAALDPFDDAAVARLFRRHAAGPIARRGSLLGLPIAAVDETPASPACAATTRGEPAGPAAERPLVVDLSALWAGPLASHLLGLAGMRVVKVESRSRPDAMRAGDPALFARLNGGKASAVVDLHDPAGRDALVALIGRANIVIEAARPRALLQLGIDAAAIVRANPGLVWVTITGHGVVGDAAQRIGFGDDCGVAGGLAAALAEVSGAAGFVGDAIADPLTGIYAARVAFARHRQRVGARLIVSMAGVASRALAAERARDRDALDASLERWAASAGQPFPPVPARPSAPLALLGADTAAWLHLAPARARSLEHAQPC